MRMRHIFICSLPLSTRYFHIISKTARFSTTKIIKHKMCVLRFFTTFVRNVYHSKKNWARYDKSYIGLHVKCPLFLSDINETLIFSTDFRKILKYQMLWKYVQWELCCSMRTDMTKLIVATSNFANASETSEVCHERSIGEGNFECTYTLWRKMWPETLQCSQVDVAVSHVAIKDVTAVSDVFTDLYRGK